MMRSVLMANLLVAGEQDFYNKTLSFIAVFKSFTLSLFHQSETFTLDVCQDFLQGSG